ncbi:hypothetical protein OG894_44715 (plasmid) [Streptomyces sp. NBC_01724]|nr:hypothetical protein [Streptomyces sp. NBC_01724]
MGQQPGVGQQDTSGDDQDLDGHAFDEMEHPHRPGRALGNYLDPPGR